MYRDRKNIKEEQRKIIGIEPVIDMKHFALLLLADLASKSHIHYFNKPNIKTAYLSAEYKKIIKDIMYEENGWGIKFAQIININSYYEFQTNWEKKLGTTIEKILKELNKEFIYDFENDGILVDFTKEEIDLIKSNYDYEVLTVMDHFSNLLNHSTFTKTWQIEMNDIKRSNARYAHYLEELSLRTNYKKKVKLANHKRLK